jgi:hypothetical protein
MTVNDDDLVTRGKAIAESGRYAPPKPDPFSFNGDAEPDDPYADVPPPQQPPDVDDHHTGQYSSDDEPADPIEGAVAHRMTWLRVDREAHRRLDEEDRPQITLPPVKNLKTLLDEPDTITRFRIDDVAPVDSRIILSAQYKAGKTIVVGNLLRALADGDAFLGKFTVNSTARLVLIDNELSENMLRRWLRDQNITHTAAIADVIALRGKVNALNLLDDRCRAQWATRLIDLGCDYLIVDCLRPVLDAFGLDEHRDAGTFLTAFDTLLDGAGVNDALIVHHMGHANERSRGDSRLQDWPDAIWRLVRENDDPSSPRYFTAYGRDVNVPEGRLGFDPATRRLTYAAGSRIDAKTETALRAIIPVIAESGSEGLSMNAIEQASGDRSRKAVRDALTRSVEQGLISVSVGPRNAKLHRITKPCAECGLPLAAGQESHHNTCPEPGQEGLFQ